jgi:hypothetical protein
MLNINELFSWKKRLLLAFYYTNYKFKYSNHWIVNPRLILIFVILNRKFNIALTTGHGWLVGWFYGA